MRTGHKLLVAAGAVVIVGMLLIATFALGVYVGEHGWTRAGLVLQGPGGGPVQPPPGDAGASSPPGAGLPQPGGTPLPGGGRRPDLVGRIRAVFEGTLVLATPDGPRTVELDEHTRVETAEGDTHPLNNLERGQHVAVFGRRSGDGQVLVAELLVLLPSTEGLPAVPPGQAPPNQP
ncbi:MAG: hypothetical protein ACE5OS_00715 [Anaerolineae bacterium]